MDKNIFKSKISVEEAKKILKEVAKPVPAEEKEVSDCFFKVLREDIKASFSSPSFNSSAMDGFALRYNSYREGEKYKIVGQVLAGKPYIKKIGKNSVLRIMTGGMVPPKMDLVIPVEDSKEEEGFVSFKGNFKRWENIRKKSEEYKKGNIILKSGKLLRAEDLGLLSSQGIKKIKVSKELETIIFITGNEFLKNKEKIKPGKIFDSNGIMISSLCKSFKVKVKKVCYLKDDFDAIKNNFDKLGNEDFYIFTGGISKGKTDYCIEAFQKSGGKILFQRVLQKPGGPFSTGLKDGKIFLFLPGNPVSAYISYFYYGSFLIKNLLSSKEEFIKKIPVILGMDLQFKKKRTEFIRMKIIKYKGKYFSFPLNLQGSHMITSLTEADGIWEKPFNLKNIKKGEEIYIWSLNNLI